MTYFPFIVLGLSFLFIITRPFTILFHELGHAIPAMLFTREKVSIYLGSYGDPKKSICFRIGLLEIYFKYNLLFWKRGLCVPAKKNISINQNLIFLLSGPLSSMLVAITCCYIAFTFDGHGALKLFFVAFTFSALFDLVSNLWPSQEPINVQSGKEIYNDGYQLKELLFFKRILPEYDAAVEYYQNKDFTQAAAAFEELLKKGKQHEKIYRAAINSYILDKNYTKALEIHSKFHSNYYLSATDYFYAGLIKSRLGMYAEALTEYNTSLSVDPSFHYAINNRGFTYNLLGLYDKAFTDFNNAIDLDPSNAYAFCNRGLSRIKLGKPEEGLKDIQYSLELDPQNSYAYMHMGIYQLENGGKPEADRLFLKAKEMDPDTYGINEWIEKAKGLS